MVSKVKVIPDVLFSLKCTVHASSKKTEYAVYVHFKQDTAEVIESRCTCVAGNGGWWFDMHTTPTRMACT